MIDARAQVGDALSTVCPNVKMSKPDGNVELPLICYSETDNTPVNLAYDRLRWRIAVYCNSFAELVRLCDAVDGIMHGQLGFTRVSKTPDDEARIGTDLYMCRLSYSAIVNTRTLGVIRHSI